MTEVRSTEIAQAWTDLTGSIPPAALIPAYFPRISDAEYETYGPKALAASAARHYDVAGGFDGTTPVVSLTNLSASDADYAGNRTVINIVLPDTRYTLSSIISELTGAGHNIRAVRHPIIVTERAGDQLQIVPSAELSRTTTSTSALPTITPGMSSTTRAKESWVHLEIDQVPEEQFDELRAQIARVLEYVIAAEADREQMRSRAHELAEQLRSAPPRPELADEAVESAELLDWLSGRFAFLGYREYSLDTTGEELSLHPIEGTAMGISSLRPPRSSQLSKNVAARAEEPRVLVLTKANSRSHVIRRSYLDYLGVKTYDENGAIVGERRFVGLYTSGMYNASVLDIPVIRQKVAWVLRESGVERDTHSGDELLSILETYPRDDLFHADVEEIFEVVMQVLDLKEKRESRVFIRRDPYARYVSVLVYVPRDLYDTDSRLRVEKVLREAYAADTVDFDVLLSESALARLHFVARVPRNISLPEVDADTVSEQITSALRSWSEDVWENLAPHNARHTAAELDRARTWSEAFPPSYIEYNTPQDAVEDIALFEKLDSDDEPLVKMVRPRGVPRNQARLSFYRLNPAGLSEILPFLSNLGASVIDERPYVIDLPDGSCRYIYDFGLEFEDEISSQDFERIEEAFAAGWKGLRETGSMDRLIVAGLPWQDLAVLRAFTHYLRQAGFSYSDKYLGSVFTSNPDLSALLLGYFHAKFDPDLTPAVGTREEHISQIHDRIEQALSEVTSLDADRVLRAVLSLIDATVRTNVFQPQDGSLPRAAVYKILPPQLDFVPKPKPAYEMWVYSPEVEGVHLRFGKVARGGLRWSDRRDDFRTEVLGLVKAQMVKNALIVPTGAKGGFVPKQLPDPAQDRDAWQAAGQAAYEVFINALLDVTDNLEYTPEGNVVVHPERTVIHDDDDSYLVVAADKGTARFSDVANGIAASRGFWLGDAFASGGSVGYDHKAMAITSRGAWKSVERHFRELGVNTATDDFTVVGIGDMSGDVFGNGMQRSEHIKLVAAFDHRDIFIDPDPDPAQSFAERRRLFELPRSSWQDYNPELISAGGGVYPRSAKSVKLSEQAAKRLGMSPGQYRPNDLIRGILCAPVDLLYNGGIGTYIKSSQETAADVGDKANDAIRVDGAELRVRVVGEGGNLGATQLGRVEAALGGVKINTDAVDNSAGVDSSDQEVNIKLLLDTLIKNGAFSSDERVDVLLSMTDEVADKVLANNYSQNVLLGEARDGADVMSGTHRRLMRYLERNADLDRAVEFLPTTKQLANRTSTGGGLTSPELAVLLAYVKMNAADEILDSDVPGEEWMNEHLLAYFPASLAERFGEHFAEHPLRRQIATARLVNRMVDRGGLTYIFRMVEETGATIPQIARVFTVVSEIFDLDSHFDDICALDNVVDSSVQVKLQHGYVRLLDRASRWLVHQAPTHLDVPSGIERYGSILEQLRPQVPQLLEGTDARELESNAQAFIAEGVPESVAYRAAALLDEFALLDVAQIANRLSIHGEDVAEVYYQVTDLLSGAELLQLIGELDRSDRWSALARGAMRDDYYQAVFAVVLTVLSATEAEGATPAERAQHRIAQWRENNEASLGQVLETIDEIRQLDTVTQTPLSVLLRMMRGIVRSTVWQSEES